MRKAGLILALTVAAFLVSSYNANPIPQDDKEGALKWYTNLDEVHQLSKKLVNLFLDSLPEVIGVDGAINCKREVFAKDAFVKWANEKVILLELDFPRKKQLPADLAKQKQRTSGSL
jgi:hypothetical protein